MKFEIGDEVMVLKSYADGWQPEGARGVIVSIKADVDVYNVRFLHPAKKFLPKSMGEGSYTRDAFHEEFDAHDLKLVSRTPQPPSRTIQIALRDALASGAPAIWADGGKIEWTDNHIDWHRIEAEDEPDFLYTEMYWRVKPPSPTVVGWQSIETLMPVKYTGYLLAGEDEFASAFHNGVNWLCHQTQVVLDFTPTHWAPMFNLPEGEK